MNFWWFILISDLLIPVIMALAGLVMWKYCPKKINWWFGYRTALSMKNMDTWAFAHNYCGRLWLIIGLIMLVPSTLLHIPFYHSSEATIGMLGIGVITVQSIVLIVSIFPTEKTLKKVFNEDGSRK